MYEFIVKYVLDEISCVVSSNEHNVNYLVEDCVLSWLSAITPAPACIKLSIVSRYSSLTYVIYVHVEMPQIINDAMHEGTLDSK